MPIALQPSRNCLQCLTPIAGRSDKKYCSDDCRALANRLRSRDARLSARSINEILWRNREILKQRWNQRPTLVTRDVLLNHGYQFAYFTNQLETAGSKDYYFCYDFGFQP